MEAIAGGFFHFLVFQTHRVQCTLQERDMLYLNEFQLAKQRHEELVQSFERARRFDQSATIEVNLVANAINALRSAFARREQAQQANARRTVTAK